MAQTRIESDVYIAGNLAARTMSIPSGTVSNVAVSASADIDTSKLQHRSIAVHQQANTTAADETAVIHVVYGSTGSIVAFKAGSIAACVGDSTVGVDLKKNGTTVLSAPITLDSNNTAYVVEAGTVSTTAVTAGDVLSVVIDATAGGGTLATGVFAYVIVDEKA